MKLGDLFIKLGLKSHEFEQGLGKAKQSVTGFKNVLGTVAKAMTAAFSVVAVINFFKTSISLANQQIEVENRLGAAIRANGKDVDQTLGRYKRFASEIQRITTVGDEVTLSMLQLAETLRSKAPEEAAKMAIGLSKALNVDLNTAMRMAVNAQSGNVMMLSRYSAEIKNATTQAEKMAAVQQMVKSGLAIATAETETAAGKVAQLKNAWGDFQETIGGVIVENGKLIKTIGDMTVAVEMLHSKGFGITSFLAFLAGGKSWEADKKRFLESLKIQEGANKAIDEYEQNIKRAKQGADQASSSNVKHAKTIADLRQEISDLKEARESLEVTDRKGITTINNDIRAIEEKIKALEDLGKAIDRAKNRPVSAIDFQTIATKGVERKKQFSWLEAPQIDTKTLTDIQKVYDTMNAQARQFHQDWMQDWGQFQEDFSNMIQDGIVDAISNFADALGQLAAGSISLDGFFNQILGQIGNFAKQLGTLLIAFGVGKLAFGEALKNFFTPMGAGTLIAAGAALVAAGGAISSLTRSKSGSGGGGSGMFNQNYNIQYATPSASKSQPFLFLKGDNIFMSQQRNEFKRGVIG